MVESSHFLHKYDFSPLLKSLRCLSMNFLGQQQMMNLSTPTKQQQCATPTTPPNIKESHRRWKVEKGRSLQVKRLASQRSNSNDVPPKKNKVCRVLYENIQ